MPKSRVKKKVEVSSREVSLVERRLEAKRKPIKGKRTLVLTTKAYEDFEARCRAKGWYPSEVIDEFIGVCLEAWG